MPVRLVNVDERYHITQAFAFPAMALKSTANNLTFLPFEAYHKTQVLVLMCERHNF